MVYFKQQQEQNNEALQQEGSTTSSGPQSRTERIHQLRAQHQRKHAERRGQYPMDDREERYEEVIRQVAFVPQLFCPFLLPFL